VEDPEKKKKKKSSTPPKKQPAKKRAPRKKAPKANVPDIPSSDTNVQPISSLLGLLKTYESPTIARRRGSIAALNNQLEEHLESYIVVGYTLDGLPVQLMHAPTPRDVDSLSTGLQKFIMNTGGI